MSIISGTVNMRELVANGSLFGNEKAETCVIILSIITWSLPMEYSLPSIQIRIFPINSAELKCANGFL